MNYYVKFAVCYIIIIVLKRSKNGCYNICYIVIVVVNDFCKNHKISLAVKAEVKNFTQNSYGLQKSENIMKILYLENLEL